MSELQVKHIIFLSLRPVSALRLDSEGIFFKNEKKQHIFKHSLKAKTICLALYGFSASQRVDGSVGAKVSRGCKSASTIYPPHQQLISLVFAVAVNTMSELLSANVYMALPCVNVTHIHTCG